MKLGTILLAGALAAFLGTGIAVADPMPRTARPHGQLRAMLVQRFDRDGDGRLSPRERKRAARALHRLAAKLGGRQGPRRAQLIQRFDTNGDGTVGPQEMPPGLAKKLRHRDRNRDGWLERNELP